MPLLNEMAGLCAAASQVTVRQVGTAGRRLLADQTAYLDIQITPAAGTVPIPARQLLHVCVVESKETTG